jgi:hypothetical protein
LLAFLRRRSDPNERRQRSICRAFWWQEAPVRVYLYSCSTSNIKRRWLRSLLERQLYINAQDKPMPNSEAGRRLLLSLSHDHVIKPFQTSEKLFEAGDQGAHNIMQKALTLLSKHKTWEVLFMHLSKLKVRSAEELTTVEMGLLRLAKTQPNYIPGWVQNKLKSSTIADGWVGAQKVYGFLWQSSIKVPFSAHSTSTGLTSAIKAPKYSVGIAVKGTMIHNTIEDLPTLRSPVTKAPITSFYKARARAPPKTKNKPGKKMKYKT